MRNGAQRFCAPCQTSPRAVAHPTLSNSPLSAPKEAPRSGARLQGILASLTTTVAVVYLAAAPARALTQDEISNLSGPDRENILIEGAKEEAKMLWYTSMIVDQAVRPMIASFGKKYVLF